MQHLCCVAVRGRKPKPSAEKALEGNPGKRPINDDEPQPPPVEDAFDLPPAELDDVEGQSLAGARQEWARLAPLLRRCRLVTEADRSALLALCLEWARYLEARAKAYPRVVKAPSGYAMPNPWLAIQTKALAGCLKLWPELGLTPSSRSRVRTAEDGPGPGGDAFSEFDAPSDDDEATTH
jgi:P27 family predicted phage terminase small subunit